MTDNKNTGDEPSSISAKPPNSDKIASDQGLKQGLLACGDGVLACGVLVALGAWAGGFLDDKLHTGPWLSISLSIAGAIGGLVRLVVNVQKLDK